MCVLVNIIMCVSVLCHVLFVPRVVCVTCCLCHVLFMSRVVVSRVVCVTEVLLKYIGCPLTRQKILNS